MSYTAMDLFGQSGMRTSRIRYSTALDDLLCRNVAIAIMVTTTMVTMVIITMVTMVNVLPRVRVSATL
jgi:hypothetical protein